jgi:hypothetical protein
MRRPRSHAPRGGQRRALHAAPLGPRAALCAVVACGGQAPSFTVAISPADPTTTDTLVAEVSLDPEPAGPPTGFAFAWFRDGEVVRDQVLAELPASRTARGQAWTVQVIPVHDGREGDSVAATVTIGDAPPSAAVVIEPAAPTAATGMIASVVAEDPDGDEVSLTWLWTREGVAQPALTGPTVDAGRVSRGQVWRVDVTPNDGAQDGPVASASVAISNAAHGGGRAAILPMEPRDPEDLVCTVAEPAVDPDGDPVTYQVAWTRNRAPWAGAATDTAWPGDTVPAAETTVGHEWACRLTPSDGQVAGAPIESAPVAILPRGPEPLESLCGREPAHYCAEHGTVPFIDIANAYCRIGGYRDAHAYSSFRGGAVERAFQFGSLLPTSCGELSWFEAIELRPSSGCLADLLCAP